jgi:phosphate transport system substrate-binding protein
MKTFGKMIYACGLGTFILLAAACSNQSGLEKSGAANGEITFTGCGIVKTAFMQEIGNAYEKKTGTKVIITGGGATKGIRFAAAEKADIGGGCRHTLNVPEEKNAKGTRVAWDGLVVIVNPDNPVKNLTVNQLNQILTGKITNWSQVGGKNVEIQVLARTGKISGVGRMTRELIFGNPEMNYTENAIIFPSTGPLETAVENNVDAIGISGASSARKRQVALLKIDGVEPSYENISSGKYPFFRPLYLFTAREAHSKAKALVSFVLSEEGQEVIKSQGTVTLKDGDGLLASYAGKMKKLGIDDNLWR